MGIVNVTPDSFADGGRYLEPGRGRPPGASARRRGGRPPRRGRGVDPSGIAAAVSADEERVRLLPVLERLLDDPPCPVSVDTSKPEVAEAALAARGPHDQRRDRAGRRAGAGPAVCAAHGAGLAVMHMRGTPAPCRPTRITTTSWRRCGTDSGPQWPPRRGPGWRPSALCVDPGIGFGKTVAHNLTLIKRLDAFRSLGQADPGRAVAEELHRRAPRPAAAGGAPRRDTGRLRHGRDGGRAHPARARRRRGPAGGPGGRGHPGRRAGMSASARARGLGRS